MRASVAGPVTPPVAGLLPEPGEWALVHRKARRLAALQWRYFALTFAVVTNRRLWCQVSGQWVDFDHDAITGYDLNNSTVTMSFAQPNPLRLSGPWALCISVAVAHLRYGANVAARIPDLAAL